MTYSSGNNDIGVLDHPSGSQDSSIESMTRSSESSDSISTIQSNNASNHTSSFPRTSADRQRTHATSEPPLSNSDRDTDHNVPRRPTQHGSHKAHHTPGVQDDVLSSNSSEIDSRSLLSRHELTKLENIQNLQRSIHPTTGPSISPNDDSFKTWLSTYVLEEFPAHKERITSRVILVLHDYSGNQNTLKVFAEEHLKEPDTSYILLRGTRSVVDSPRRYHWADSDYFLNRSFLEATWTIGQFILEGLVKKHNISPRNIVLFGHGQGGMVALSVAASWNTTELGGVITVGGPLPEHFTLPSKADISTPVLVLGGELGSINPIAERRIRDFFMYVETNLAPNIKDILPPSRDKISISMLKEFLAHRLWQREWIQPSIMALDGGGIRGYGTLLILKELMNRIGNLEKKLDPKTVSSFYPQPYRPTKNTTVQAANGQPASLVRKTTTFMEPSSIDGLQNSELFYPCHYFTYIGGTSTGGLISIMLSRLRMNVEDSLTEYKRLGGRVFGSPRPIPNKGIVWHKFNWRRLQGAIDEVVQRHHSRTDDLIYKWPSEVDFCRTIVVAYASTETTETPYLLRTYEAFDHEEQLERRHAINKIRNPGPAQNLDIPAVGRATSAAPGYFAPAEIRINGGQTIKFKDGGFGCNNPSDEIRRDVRALNGSSNKNLGPFISIGTGTDRVIEKFPTDGAFKHIRGFWRNLKSSTDMVSLTAGAHESMLDAASDGDDENFPYFRFDGGERLGALKMDAWVGHKLVGITGRDPTPGCKTIEEMNTAVAMYLQNPHVSAKLDEVAELLVRRRRYQIRDKSKWDRYACASWYQCPYPCKGGKRFDTLCGFREHVLREHRNPAMLADLETELAKFRHCWIYPALPKEVPTIAKDTKGKGVKRAVNGLSNSNAGAPYTNGVLHRG